MTAVIALAGLASAPGFAQTSQATPPAPVERQAGTPAPDTQPPAADQVSPAPDTSGDIVVTDERAKQLSAPPATKAPPTKGRTAAPPAEPAAAAAPPPANEPPAAEPSEPTGTKRPVRSVGPTFIPAR